MPVKTVATRLSLLTCGLLVLSGCKPVPAQETSGGSSSSEASSAEKKNSVTYLDIEWGVSFEVPLFDGIDPPFTDTKQEHVYRLVEFGPMEKKQFGYRRYTMTDYAAPHSLTELEDTVKNNTTFNLLKDDLAGDPPTEITVDGKTYLRWVLHQGCAQVTVTIVGKTQAFSFSTCSKGDIAAEVQELQEIASTVKFLK